MKARIVAESYATSVGEAADRYGLVKTQLFTWRREARQPLQAASSGPMFAPVIVEPALPVPKATPRPDLKSKKARRARRGGIELEIDGVVVRVERGAEAKTVAAVIQALKAER